MPESMQHSPQLSRPRSGRGAQVIAVASGKGGVGKTLVAVNLATVQAQRGKRVWLLDADFGLANVDVVLGLDVERNLSDVLDGRCELQHTVLQGPEGVQIVPASSGVSRMAALGASECGGLIQAFSELADDADLLLVDTAAGISASVTLFAQAAQHTLVVVCDEPASIVDAYALIKVLVREHGVARIQVLANMVKGPAHGLALFNKLNKVTSKYIEVNLGYAGWVPHDDFLKKALARQTPVVSLYPQSRAATAFGNLASLTDRWELEAGASGQVSFFFERAFRQQSEHAGRQG